MMRSRKFLTAIAVTTVGLAACGGGSDDDGAASSEPASSETAEGDDASPSGSPGGTLRYAAGNEPSRFDLHRSSNGYDQNWFAPVYERLIHQTPQAELEPGLALEWEFADDTTFVMSLREGVSFHDGAPFDAEAVKANIERAKTVEGSGLANYLASVDTVEVLDEYEVQFNLSQPDATLPMQLATRPGMMLSPDAFENADLDDMPVGTGPFELVEYSRGDRAVYEKVDDYWDPDYAQVDQLEIFYMPDAVTRLNALRSGQVDAAVLEPSQVSEAEGAGLNVDVSDSLEVYHFQMDRTKSEFGDVLVRQALNHAVDREAIVEGLVFGYGQPTTQWVPEGTPFYNEEFGPDYYPYDPDRARELLAEAGLEDGFEFDAMVSTNPIYVRLGEIVKEQFAEIGVDMELRQEQQLADAFFTRNDADAIVSPYPGRIDPTETAQIYFNDESFSNPGRQVTPTVKDAYFEALVPGDDRPEAVKALSGQIVEDALGVPMLFPNAILASTEDVGGLTWYLSGHIEFDGVTVNPG